MTGKGRSRGTLVSTSDPRQQHLIGSERFLKYEPDDHLLVTIWSREDYPEDWDKLMGVWHHTDDDRMVGATRQIIDAVLEDRTEGEDEC
jgi:hypothetical protein